MNSYKINSDCVTARVDYVESVGSAVCGKHAVSNFGASFGRSKSFSVYRSTFILSGKFLHEHFVSPQEVASLSQQGRIAAAKCACKVFSIEYGIREAGKTTLYFVAAMML